MPTAHFAGGSAVRLTGGIMGLLYALKRFSYTAAGGAVFNLASSSLRRCWQTGSRLRAAAGHPGRQPDAACRHAAWGARCAAAAVAAWRHPAVQRILRLYAPIALGDCHPIPDHRGWPLGLGDRPQSVSWMRYATTLISCVGLIRCDFAGRTAHSLAIRRDPRWIASAGFLRVVCGW